jgi:quercetin dioxygenase-like cupin family protein
MSGRAEQDSHEAPRSETRVMASGSAITSETFGELDTEEPYPGVVRRSLSTDEATVTGYWFAPRATFPRHRHPQEQITLVQHGAAEFTIGETIQSLAAGAWSVVPGGVEHGLRAGPDGAHILAVLVPRRDRTDAYTVVEAPGAAA